MQVPALIFSIGYSLAMQCGFNKKIDSALQDLDSHMRQGMKTQRFLQRCNMSI